MPRKGTKKEYVNRANLVHNFAYDYSKFIYTGIEDKSIVICPKHGEFSICMHAHVRGYGCKLCSEFSTEGIIKRFQAKFGDKYDYSKFVYSGMDKSSIIICPIHNELIQTPYTHLLNKYGCSECSGKPKYDNGIIDWLLYERSIIRVGDFKGTKKHLEWQCKVCNHKWNAAPYEVLRSDKTGCPKCSHRMPLTNEVIDERMIGRTIKRIGDFVRVDIKLEWECNVCQFKWFSRPQDIIKGGFGCHNCSGNRRLTNEIIDQKLIGRDLKRLDDFKTNRTKIRFQCTKCNYIWNTTTKVVLNIGCNCPVCAMSSNEGFVKEAFDANQMDYIFQANVGSIIGNDSRYRFDFYFPKSKIAVEYNGAQHYRVVTFAGKVNLEEAEANFIKQQQRDNHIREVCKINNINLIEIDGRIY